MREQLSKMTLRQLSLWLMVMLDPAYKALYTTRSSVPTELEFPQSVDCLLNKSIIIFQRFLAADSAGQQQDIIAVLDAAHHITAIPIGQAWVGRAVYSVMLGLELLLDELVNDRSPDKEVHLKRSQRGLHQLELAVPEIAQTERTEAYYQHLSALGAKLNAMETLIDSDPFGQPIPSDVIESTLRGTYFDEGWRRANS